MFRVQSVGSGVRRMGVCHDPNMDRNEVFSLSPTIGDLERDPYFSGSSKPFKSYTSAIRVLSFAKNLFELKP